MIKKFQVKNFEKNFQVNNFEYKIISNNLSSTIVSLTVAAAPKILVCYNFIESHFLLSVDP